MVIHPNASPGFPIPSNLQPKRKPVGSEAGTGEEAAISLSSRSNNRLSTTPPIFDVNRAEEVTDFLRHHILTRPADSISVQANMRPQRVFELLDGILE